MKIKIKISIFSFFLYTLFFLSTYSLIFPVYALNGLLLEPSDPTSAGMGGASVAMAIGAGGVFSNPATLTLMSNRIRNVQVSGQLLPSTKGYYFENEWADSDAMSVSFPVVGYAERNGNIALGLGFNTDVNVTTDYDQSSLIGQLTGRGTRSEYHVNSLVLPFSYRQSKRLSLGFSGSLFFSQADLVIGYPIKKVQPNGQELPSAGTFSDFSKELGGSHIMGSLSGSLANSVNMIIKQLPANQRAQTRAVIDVSDGNSLTGKTRSVGVGLKVGLLYRATKDFNIGLSYQMETNLGDMQGQGLFRLIESSNDIVGNIDLSGNYQIKGFRLPAITTLGLGYRIFDSTWVTGDYSYIAWSKVMRSIDIHFETDQTISSFNGQQLDLSLKQNWKDQQVIKLGLAHRLNDKLTLRVGVNIANNPIPSETVNPLFPFIAEKQISTGFTYAINRYNRIVGSISYSPLAIQKNSHTQATTSASFNNIQIGYNYIF